MLAGFAADGSLVDPRFDDHFRNPRNSGDLPEADARAEVENPVCGDVLILAVALAGGRLDQVVWRVRGCSGAIAAASAMSELARGQTPAAARSLDRDAIDAALGGLPPLKRHGADLASDGLRAVLDRLASPEGA